MANIAKLVASVAWTNAITTGANSLANNSNALSSSIDNSTNLDMFADLSVILASLTPGTGGYVELHLCPLSSDGTNYALLSSSTVVGNVILPSGTAAKYGVVCGVMLPPGLFKLGINNVAGVSLGASGNIVAYRTYNTNLNG